MVEVRRLVLGGLLLLLLVSNLFPFYGVISGYLAPLPPVFWVVPQFAVYQTSYSTLVKPQTAGSNKHRHLEAARLSSSFSDRLNCLLSLSLLSCDLFVVLIFGFGYPYNHTHTMHYTNLNPNPNLFIHTRAHTHIYLYMSPSLKDYFNSLYSTIYLHFIYPSGLFRAPHPRTAGLEALSDESNIEL